MSEQVEGCVNNDLVNDLVSGMHVNVSPLTTGGDSLPYEIKIKPLNYGYIVNVGCQSFAIEDKNKLLKNLEAYLTNPSATEKKWRENKELL